ncbi:type I methionyl aminopeptidase [Mangrovactinospora gilvigrisea]|uniref:Methionine aminopeptidase n=1 Tax=Mangrovactinospora gilvigrisea TaxID=1428644 RepID=A0A1J7CCH3_9ACTN|nr:type I methionyl aminopeptidase [Mangrovactinospora gilvigrisea]OIV39224.1 type I methionyl aminopeptidase [Mangrovactinospora gilvigrisea]
MLGGRKRIQLKTPEQVAKMRAAGLVVARALEAVRAAVRPGVTTAQLDEVAAKVIRDHGAKSNFLGYYGYPATVCASPNDTIVHGIPNDIPLQDGDLLSVDCGAIVDGWHGDSAMTVPVGAADAESLELSRVTEESMWRGIAAMRDGGRVSDISHAVESYVRSQTPPAGRSYGITEDFGGHGIGTAMHMDPHVLNYGRPGQGARLRTGMCLAIEPMVTLGTAKHVTLEDEWTVKTTDGSRAAHWEHSVALTPEGLLVLTAFDGGREKLSELGATVAPDPAA